ncbi:MAG TPA: hypothetical protein VHZ55_30965 [Bryobacteraceae bacterium]|nr:hypothetical protein [Bryobacteraceae bacterium]
MSKPPFYIASLSMMLFDFSASLDTGKCDGISVTDVKKHAAIGDLFQFLEEETDANFHSSFIESDPEFKSWYLDKLRGLCIEVDERRKYNIDNRGLCLLISHTAEIIQQGKDIRMKGSK